ncbi:hypothetical protein DP939_06215 [Spongiactinospora rosea]|uniref:NAD(P)-binding domain-containing protein n=1 Tax=Spongiactinospora rosea TaxID=2248750 RepID=A0A366M3A3_9ACTN|nr:NAD(P)H-binding protein [Spongiactinospora rosea]RBQ20676.1 hypothetical protein DP939_06215 [Spongiactinospora rosea]
MRIAVLGATGPTGVQIVREAVAAGYEVTAVVRRPEAVEGEKVRVVRGDVLEAGSLEGAFDGVGAVLSAVGSHSGRKPTYVYSRGMANVRAEMVEAGVRRLVVVGAVPVQTPQESAPLDRFVVHPLLRSLFGGGYDDLRRMEAELRAGGGEVDWTVLRVPRLLNGPPRGEYRVAVERPLRGARDIRRADLARAMLAAIEDAALVGKVATVAR